MLWAGEPRYLHCDPHRSHVPSALQSWCRRHDMMEAGVSPYQAVFGRVPRQVTPLVHNPGVFAAHDAVNMDAEASIAESARAAALKAFYELDRDRAMRIAMTRGPTGGSHRPLQPGDVIYFFREAITNKTSNVQQKLAGLQGPAIVLFRQGTSCVRGHHMASRSCSWLRSRRRRH